MSSTTRSGRWSRSHSRAAEPSPSSWTLQPVAPQVFGDHLADHRLVVDDEHEGGQHGHGEDSTTGASQLVAAARRVSRAFRISFDRCDRTSPYRCEHGRDHADARQQPPTPVDRRAAALSGVVAAGVALGVGQFVSGLAGSGPTLVTAVGTQFIDRFAASLKDLAVAAVRHERQGGAGRRHRRRVAAPRRAYSDGRRRAGCGSASSGSSPSVSSGCTRYAKDPQGEISTAIVASALRRRRRRGDAGRAAAPGAARPARSRSPTSSAPAGPSRRTFVVTAGVLAAGAVGAAVLGRRVGVHGRRRRGTAPHRAAAAGDRDARAAPAPATPTIAGSVAVHHADRRLLPHRHRARRRRRSTSARGSSSIKGMVDRPYSLTL